MKAVFQISNFHVMSRMYESCENSSVFWLDDVPKKKIAVKKPEMRVTVTYRLPFHGFLNQVSAVWMLNWLVNSLSVICLVELLNKSHGCHLSLRRVVLDSGCKAN